MGRPGASKWYCLDRVCVCLGIGVEIGERFSLDRPQIRHILSASLGRIFTKRLVSHSTGAGKARRLLSGGKPGDVTRKAKELGSGKGTLDNSHSYSVEVVAGD